MENENWKLEIKLNKGGTIFATHTRKTKKHIKNLFINLIDDNFIREECYCIVYLNEVRVADNIFCPFLLTSEF